MTQKIIVADDSQTIQKVVAITLANDSYELVPCLNENDLVKQVAAGDSALVLLDFNLSDSKDGYQLAAELKQANSQITVMALMGTFDVAEQAKMKSAGIDDHIAKPFDSNLFIQKCRSLTNGLDSLEADDQEDEWEGDTEGEIKFDEDDQDGDNDLGESEDIEENWVMDSSQVTSENDEEDELEDSQQEIEGYSPSEDSDDELSSELAGWGIPIPSKIGGTNVVNLMPPIINDEHENVLEEGISVDLSEDQNSVESEEQWPEVELTEGESLAASDDEETSLPEEDDLEYPEMDLVGSSQEDLKDIKLSSHLVEVDELAPESESSIELSAEELMSSGGDLAEEIASEDSPDDFWAADEVVSDEPGQRLSASVGGAIANPDIAQSVDEHAVSTDSDALAPLESNLSLELTPSKPAKEFKEAANEQPVASISHAIDEDQLVAKIKDSLAPLIEEMVKKQVEAMMKERVDHIAWEVIPDLAENLIRDEIKNISSDL